MQIDLTGKRALVTGGSGDIGRAICLALAHAGARIAFTYFSDREGADQTTTTLRDKNIEPVVVRANFSDEQSTLGVVDAVRTHLGAVDIFISNAASGVLRPLGELKIRHWQWALDINARAFFTISQALVRHTDDAPLMTNGGRIVALSSLGATRAIPQYAVVGASKAALESLARHLALDLGPSGINVNIVSPGIVKTKALQYFPNREQLLDVAGSRTPLGRLTTPKDVANLVLFLCSDAAAMIHGQTIHVDGGYSILA